MLVYDAEVDEIVRHVLAVDCRKSCYRRVIPESRLFYSPVATIQIASIEDRFCAAAIARTVVSRYVEHGAANRHRP